ncbi:hypothetical protein GCM10029964_049670 [Kibdelosporangium lantanae]
MTARALSSGRNESISTTVGGTSPSATICLAISSATTPPMDHPTSTGGTSVSACRYLAAMVGRSSAASPDSNAYTVRSGSALISPEYESAVPPAPGSSTIGGSSVPTCRRWTVAPFPGASRMPS